MTLTKINIKPAKKLLFFALFVYGSAVFSVLISAVVWFIKILLVVVLITNFKKYLGRHIQLTHPQAVNSFWKSSSGFWFLHLNNSNILTAFIQQNTIVTNFLILLNFITDTSVKISVLITPESIGQHEFRRLLIHLHHGKHPHC